VSFRKQNQKEASRPKQLTRQLRPNSNSDRSREFSNSAVPRDQLVRTNAKTNFYRGQTSNKFDPFNALPVGEEGHSHYLISNSRLPRQSFSFLLSLIHQAVRYLFHPTTRRYSPIRPIIEESESLRAAIFDSALLHIALAHISTSLSNLTGTKLGPEAFYHIAQGIAIVNKRLANFRRKTVTDNTICAITILTHLEVRAVSCFYICFKCIMVKMTLLLAQIW
jgi:hypothetical protein